MLHIRSSSAACMGYTNKEGQKSFILIVLSRQFDLFLLQGTWENL